MDVLPPDALSRQLRVQRIDLNPSASGAEAVSFSTASPRERELECGFVPHPLAGCYTCSPNPGRPPPPVSPAAEQRAPYGTASRAEPHGGFVSITATSLCKARKQPCVSPPLSAGTEEARTPPPPPPAHLPPSSGFFLLGKQLLVYTDGARRLRWRYWM